MSQTPTDILKSLNEEQRAQVQGQVRRGRVPASTVLIEEGEADDSLTYVESGELRVDRGGVAIDYSGPGEVIGEMALFGEGLRTASVHVVKDTTILLLDKAGFEVLRAKRNPFAFWIERMALAQLSKRLRRLDALVADLSDGVPSSWIKPPPSMFQRVTALFRKTTLELLTAKHCDVPALLYESPLFKGTPHPFLVQISEELEMRPVAAGTFLCEQGSAGDELFIIARGAVDVLVTTGGGDGAVRVHKLAQVGAGGAVGLSALADGAPRSASCVAVEPTDVLVLSRERWDALRAADHLLGSEVRQAVIRGLSGALAEAATHLVALDRQRSGRPTMSALPASPAPLDEPVAPSPIQIPDQTSSGPVQVFLDPAIGVSRAAPEAFEAPDVPFGALMAACASEVSRGE